ncbi:MAG: sugar transferase [Candidatus Neomarinimicrobiota bacterium]|nr:sugar transferase [Candidatus Neomarinimicrobiota bacterium]MDD3966583.1 sugar transferase [Candidatus Neomarinimicrobiota bacterium]MDX9780802.1 sugar transferase [bacterium]
MSRGYKALLFVSDFLSTMSAFFGVYWLRYRSGLFPVDIELYISDLWLPALFIYLYWLIFYFYFGLYHLPEAPSRTDENVKVFKSTSYGVILLFLITFDVFNPFSLGRLIIIIYWLAQLFMTILLRSIILSVRHKQLMKGIGLTPSFIVGCNPKGYDIQQKIEKYPALGYKVLGFISTDGEAKTGEEYNGIPVLGDLESVSSLIRKYQVRQLVVAFGSDKHDKVLEVIDKVAETRVGIKILPDMYDIISGLARTQQIYGIPLIDINPGIMQPWEKAVKRLFDVLISVLVLLVFLPFGLLLALLIILDSRGPVFYTQERLGLYGKPFRIIKFRSMKHDVGEPGEKVILTTKDDERVTRIGKLIRRYRIDEVPQMLNVLKGDMSLIGPRPDMPKLTEQLEKQIPLYRHRMKVKPGITGWAQISVPYPQTQEEVIEKFNCDIYYIENMSLKLDLKIILNTIVIMFSGSGT